MVSFNLSASWFAPHPGLTAAGILQSSCGQELTFPPADGCGHPYADKPGQRPLWEEAWKRCGLVGRRLALAEETHGVPICSL